MKNSKVAHNTFLVRLEKGEEVIHSIEEFCKKEHIQNAFLSALGSVENPTLAHYLVTTKHYTEKQLQGIYELTNLTGNVTLFERKPIVHAHVSLSDEEMHALGGHLVSAVVSATIELTVTQLDSKIEKKHSEEIGLKLLDLSHKI